MNAHNKTSSRKVDIYSSINDLVVFKIANIGLNYFYKTDRSKNCKTRTKRNNQYERRVKNFFEREIFNYSCRIAPVLSESFWETNFDVNVDVPIVKSQKMDFRFGSNLKNSKLKVLETRNKKAPATALGNLKKIEFFTTKTMLEVVEIYRSRDFDVIHSYLVDTQKRIRDIFDTITEYAIVDWGRELRVSQPSIQKNLIIHLFHLDRINLQKPELSLRIRKCITKKQFPKKSDSKSPYFYAKRLEEDKYCSKKCLIDFPSFDNAKNQNKKVKRRKPRP